MLLCLDVCFFSFIFTKQCFAVKAYAVLVLNSGENSILMFDYVVCASLWRLLIIAVSPSIRGSEEVSPLTVVEGSLIALVCESSGIPPPSLTWRKDGMYTAKRKYTTRILYDALNARGRHV